MAHLWKYRGPSPRRGRRASSPRLESLEGRALMATDTFQFGQVAYTVPDTVGSATVTITRTGGTDATSLLFMTHGGSAVAGTDYTPVQTQVNFPAGATSETVSIPIAREPNAGVASKYFGLLIGGLPANGAFGNPSSSQLTINYTGTAPAGSRPYVILTSNGQIETAAPGGGSSYTATSSLPGGLTAEDVQAVKLGNGNTMVFALGSDHQVYDETVADNGTPQTSFQLAAYGSVASMSAGTNAGGNPILFAVGTDKQLYEQTLNPDGTPSSGSYTKATYGNFQQAFLTHDASGNPLLYATGYYASNVYAYVLQLPPSGTSSSPLPLKQMGTGAVTQITIGHDASKNPELFVIGTDGYAYSLKGNATGLPASGYIFVGGPVNSITAGSDASGDPLLFMVGTDKNAYEQKFTASGTASGKLAALPAIPGGTTSLLAAGSNASGNPVVYAVSAGDSQLYGVSLDASGNAAGPFFLAAPGAVKKVSLD